MKKYNYNGISIAQRTEKIVQFNRVELPVTFYEKVLFKGESEKRSSHWKFKISGYHSFIFEAETTWKSCPINNHFFQLKFVLLKACEYNLILTPLQWSSTYLSL